MSEIQEPRDQAATMASDWEWILATLRMVEDRALTGTPLQITRPSWMSANADVRLLMRNAVAKQIDAIFSTAVVVEPEKSDVGES